MLGLTMEYKFWVYIVASRTGTFYVGMTNNIERRVSEHKSGEFEGFAREWMQPAGVLRELR
jgi:putative endonuclease